MLTREGKAANAALALVEALKGLNYEEKRAIGNAVQLIAHAPEKSETCEAQMKVLKNLVKDDGQPDTAGAEFREPCTCS